MFPQPKKSRSDPPKRGETRCGRAISRVLSPETITRFWGAVIPLGASLPMPSCGLVRNLKRAGSARELIQALIRLPHDLAPGRVCLAAPVTRGAVRSYRTISPLPPAMFGMLCGETPENTPARDGVFSVALSFELPRPAVNRYPCPMVPGLSSRRHRRQVPSPTGVRLSRRSEFLTA